MYFARPKLYGFHIAHAHACFDATHDVTAKVLKLYYFLGFMMRPES